MRYDQITTTADLLAAAQLERYHDLRREAELARILKDAQPADTAPAPAINLFQRVRQWINAPVAAPQTPTTGFKGV